MASHVVQNSVRCPCAQHWSGICSFTSHKSQKQAIVCPLSTQERQQKRGVAPRWQHCKPSLLVCLAVGVWIAGGRDWFAMTTVWLELRYWAEACNIWFLGGLGRHYIFVVERIVDLRPHLHWFVSYWLNHFLLLVSSLFEPVLYVFLLLLHWRLPS